MSAYRFLIKQSVQKNGLTITIDNRGFFNVNSFEITEEDRIWMFEQYGSFCAENNLITAVKDAVYSINIGKDKYSFRKSFENGVKYVFTKNEIIHSSQGYAKQTPKYNFYMRDGDLHRTDGPAIENRFIGNDKDIYILNGQIVNFTDFIAENPKSSQSHLYHKGKIVEISANKNHQVIKIGNHKWLLKKTEIKDNVDNDQLAKQVILSSLYKKISGHTIIKYHAPNAKFKEIDDTLQSLFRFNKFSFSQNLITGVSYISGDLPNQHSLVLEINEFNNTIDFEKFNSVGKCIEHIKERLDGLLEMGDEMSTIKTGHLSSIDDLSDTLDQLFPPKLPQVEVYGITIPQSVFSTSYFDKANEAYYWKDKEGKLHNPGIALPAVIYQDSTMAFYEHGYLHNPSGPAKINFNDKTKQEYWLHNYKVSFDEYIHYIMHEKKIVFTNNGQLHRTDGPAIIDFSSGIAKKEYWNNGVKKMSENEAYVDPFKKDPLLQSSGWTIHVDDLSEKLKTIQAIEEERMIQEEEEEIVLTRGGPDLTGSKISQIWEGGIHGFKQGAIKTSSKMIADKIVQTAKLDLNEELASKLIQIILMMLSAEVIAAVPEAIAEKIKLDYDTQQEIVSLFRVTSGETIGRELMALTTEVVVPQIKDILTNFSTKEIVDFAKTYEKSEPIALESAEKRVTLDDLLNQSREEEVVQEEVEVEYV